MCFLRGWVDFREGEGGVLDWLGVVSFFVCDMSFVGEVEGEGEKREKRREEKRERESREKKREERGKESKSERQTEQR